MTDFTITQEWIDKHRTDAGSWTYDQLRAVGVEIPPTHGWLRRIIGTTITDECRQRFELRLFKGAAKALLRGPTPPLSQKAQRKAAKKAARRAKAMAAAAAYERPHKPQPNFSPKPEPQKITQAYRDFYNTPEWRKLRYRAFLVLGRVCACCYSTGDIGKPLHVDHIKPRYYFPKLELVLENLQILCEDCNLGKGAWDETDWRTDEQKQHMRNL